MHTQLHTVPPTLQQATTDPHFHQGLLDTHGRVWVSLLWGHCSFFLGPGTQGSVCSLQESVSWVLWSSRGSMVGLMATSSKRAYTIPRSTAPRAPVPEAVLCRPITPQGTLKHRSVSVSVGVSGSWSTQGIFEPSECLWWVWVWF